MLGLAGVTALKNLLEEGFEAVGFEQNERVGGLWNHSTDVTQTTVLKSLGKLYCVPEPCN